MFRFCCLWWQVQDSLARAPAAAAAAAAWAVNFILVAVGWLLWSGDEAFTRQLQHVGRGCPMLSGSHRLGGQGGTLQKFGSRALVAGERVWYDAEVDSGAVVSVHMGVGCRITAVERRQLRSDAGHHPWAAAAAYACVLAPACLWGLVCVCACTCRLCSRRSGQATLDKKTMRGCIVPTAVVAWVCGCAARREFDGGRSFCLFLMPLRVRLQHVQAVLSTCSECRCHAAAQASGHAMHASVRMYTLSS
ncbi:hypothetical protein COO60DRAFT_1295901 [Scenedesmus sp. NREL 46B-D3]|nr:hypothetical protein COO60DRAFT_1295901 [Scenedesmus sp. NREL 46B-D3]